MQFRAWIFSEQPWVLERNPAMELSSAAAGHGIGHRSITRQILCAFSPVYKTYKNSFMQLQMYREVNTHINNLTEI